MLKFAFCVSHREQNSAEFERILAEFERLNKGIGDVMKALQQLRDELRGKGA